MAAKNKNAPREWKKKVSTKKYGKIPKQHGDTFVVACLYSRQNLCNNYFVFCIANISWYKNIYNLVYNDNINMSLWIYFKKWNSIRHLIILISNGSLEFSLDFLKLHIKSLNARCNLWRFSKTELLNSQYHFNRCIHCQHYNSIFPDLKGVPILISYSYH